MNATQAPLETVGGPERVYNPQTDTWADTKTTTGDTNQQRLERLMSAGAVSALEVLKLRLDVLTDFLVDPRLVDLMEGMYEQNLGGFLEMVEQRHARQQLTAGIDLRVAAR